jgi:putative heme degradation protein
MACMLIGLRGEPMTDPSPLAWLVIAVWTAALHRAVFGPRAEGEPERYHWKELKEGE